MHDSSTGSGLGHHVAADAGVIADTAWLLAELVALFFGVAFVIQLIQRRLGPERLRTWMGGSPVASALKGIAIGFVTPFCTYSAIPMLVGLRQAGVPPAGYVAFIAAAPVLDPVLFGALVLIVGPSAALLYAAIAFAGAMALALAAQQANIEAHLKPIAFEHSDAPTVERLTVGVPSGGHNDTAPLAGATASTQACGAEQPPWRGLRAEAGAASSAAFALLRSVAMLLLAGVAIGLIIEAAVAPSDIARLTGNHDALSIPIAAALGTPLYFHTSLFVPIADALTNAGVGIGAIVALTISGAGANVPEFVILCKLADKRLIAIFFTYVFAVALTGGLLAQLALG
ncbi:MAG: permease [Acidimicrobiales bacterium]